MKKLSIIIPLYNTEKYIARCIRSCVEQSVESSDYEIIVVNDGSTDNSLQIAKSFENDYPHITVVTQKNQKQGAARNKGLTLAKGEYIWFVDSDDWIEPTAVKDLITIVQDNKVDIIRFDAFDHKNEQITPRLCNHIANHIYNRHEAFLENNFSVCVPFHLFRRQFLTENGFKFLTNIFFEDNELMVKIIERTNTFLYVKKHFYNVLLRDNSTTRTTDYSRYLNIVTVINSHVEYLSNNYYEENVRAVFCKRIARNLNSLLVGTARSPHAFQQAVNSLKKIDALNEIVKSSGSSFHLTEYRLLQHPDFLRRLLLIYYHRTI